VVEQVPLGHVELALTNLIAIAVPVGIILADPGGTPHGTPVFAGRRHTLQAARVGNLSKAIAVGVMKRRRVARL
jgi:hypothetical protein